MFGYINVSQPDLRVRELVEFRAFYCGLCHVLGEKYTLPARLSVSYDMTFLAMLLTDLYEPEVTTEQKRCVVHPLSKRPVLTSCYTEYAADMNLALFYLHAEDDIQDEHKIAAYAERQFTKEAFQEISRRYPRQVHAMTEQLQIISREEKKNSTDYENMSSLFGRVMGELFVVHDDLFEEDLRGLGFYLGKFVYLMDAYEDYPEDLKNGRYNPLKNIGMDICFREKMQDVLMRTAAEAAACFERLPIVRDQEIFRNILYQGVWKHFDQTGGNDGVKSI